MIFHKLFMIFAWRNKIYARKKNSSNFFILYIDTFAVWKNSVNEPGTNYTKGWIIIIIS